MPISATMMDFPLSVGHLFRHGNRVHGASLVTTWSPHGVRRASFAQVAERAGRLASLLRRIGVKPGSVVGTLAWNHQAHLEAYLAVPSMGAVLHTLNLRLSSDELSYIINHGEDEVILCDGSLLPLLGAIADRLPKLRTIIVIGEAAASADGVRWGAIEMAGDYENLIASETSSFKWPDVDERAPAAMCYTSGTTGNPKGVVYSHRSQVLHAMSINAASNFAITDRDKVLVIVPLFHASAWGTPYGGWMAGADFLLPQQYLQAPHLAAMIEEERPSFSAAVPTIWSDLLTYADQNPVDLSSMREVISGGAAVPRALIERFHNRFGVPMTQGWGMTECSPLAALARPPARVSEKSELDYRAHTGRVIPGVELRIVDDAGAVLPWDGEAAGEIQLKGAWVTGAYFGGDGADKFVDGWLRTGDVGTVDPAGFVQLVDRAKDIVKSGGEWISSVALENALMGHADVVEAAVIAIPDARWGERPLPCVVLRQGTETAADDLHEWLSPHFPKWWLPEQWAFIDAVPRTSVGKFDKKALRKRYNEQELKAERLNE